ncbi:MAG: AEC family transporter [Thiotrichales bacterium]|nr:AEC family transporter [Thiotrichales bacterium]
MVSTLGLLLPVFALIALGAVAGKTGVLGETAARELSRFVIWLALPALLFTIMANSDWRSLWQPEFLLVYLLATFSLFVLVWSWRRRYSTLEAGMDALAAAYSNTGYIGFPLLFLVFGSVSEVPTALASMIVVAGLFALAVMLIESAIHHALSWYQRLWSVSLGVLKNPLLVAPAAGAIFAATDWSMPAPVSHFLSLLAAAASPVALISLGLFLVQSHQRSAANVTPFWTIDIHLFSLVVGKLILLPLLVAILAFWVIPLPPLWAWMAVILAALPTGTGPYMLAEFYQADARRVAQTILFSTLFSLLTLSVLLHWIPETLRAPLQP